VIEAHIRPMAEPDLLAYKALRDAMLAGHPEAFTSDAGTEGQRDLSSYRNRLAGGSSGATLFTLVALDDARLVGALTCEREPRLKVQHIAHLIGMMVSDTHRGRGVGRALLIAAVDKLRATPGLAQVTLSVTATNRAAIGLYESQGFTRYGCLPDAIRLPGGRSLAKDLMRLRLE
jgi:ribosomal protein S18 acetylase RimI-like enzyme